MRVQVTTDGDVTDPTWPSAEIAQCPFPYYAALREQAPVYKYPGRENEYIVSRWAEIVNVAQHPELFSNVTAPNDPKIERAQSFRRTSLGMTPQGHYSSYSMALSDPPEHKEKRAMGLKLVSHERLRAYEPMIEQIGNELIDGFIDRGTCEFRQQFSNVLPVHVICNILGLPREDATKIVEWGNISGSHGSRYLSDEQLEKEGVLGKQAGDYVRRALLERLENPTGDYLSEMIQLQVERNGGFDLQYATAESLILLFGGNVTTAHLLSSAMVLLCRNPAVMERVRDDHTLIRQMLEEALRLESPVQWVLRICKQDAEIAGVPIPAGAVVVLVWASGSRDENKFDDPECLSLDRADVARHQLAFGRGIHLCLGAPLARLEGKIAFQVLFSRLANIRLVNDNEITAIDNILFRAPRTVQIAFDRA